MLSITAEGEKERISPNSTDCFSGSCSSGPIWLIAASSFALRGFAPSPIPRGFNFSFSFSGIVPRPQADSAAGKIEEGGRTTSLFAAADLSRYASTSDNSEESRSESSLLSALVSFEEERGER